MKSLLNPAPGVMALTLLLAVSMAAPVMAQEADAAAGKEYFYTCTGCHGIPGYSNVYPTYKVPKIAGQNEQYLINALQAYRDGSRQHPTMQIQARSMTAQDIRNVAAYLAQSREDS